MKIDQQLKNLFSFLPPLGPLPFLVHCMSVIDTLLQLLEVIHLWTIHVVKQQFSQRVIRIKAFILTLSISCCLFLAFVLLCMNCVSKILVTNMKRQGLQKFCSRNLPGIFKPDKVCHNTKVTEGHLCRVVSKHRVDRVFPAGWCCHKTDVCQQWQGMWDILVVTRNGEVPFQSTWTDKLQTATIEHPQRPNKETPLEVCYNQKNLAVHFVAIVRELRPEHHAWPEDNARQGILGVVKKKNVNNLSFGSDC